MALPRLHGSIPALVTPFRDGGVDAETYQRFIDWQIAQGSHALVACGTTGESPTVSHEENKRVIDLAVEAAAGRVPVLAGTGSNATHEALALTRHAERAGADAALIVTPYYNKPSQEGLYQHFKAIHDAVEIPIVIYNIPGRCVVDMTVETLARLAALPRIIGVKDSSNDIKRPYLTRMAIGESFIQLSGEDPTVLPFLAMGGHGCISVTANVAPGPLARMHAAWARGDVAEAQAINEMLMPLHAAMFAEPSPAPAKYGVSLLGFGAPEVRLPMTACGPAVQGQVREAMAAAGVLA